MGGLVAQAKGTHELELALYGGACHVHAAKAACMKAAHLLLMQQAGTSIIADHRQRSGFPVRLTDMPASPQGTPPEVEGGLQHQGGHDQLLAVLLVPLASRRQSVPGHLRLGLLGGVDQHLANVRSCAHKVLPSAPVGRARRGIPTIHLAACNGQRSSAPVHACLAGDAGNAKHMHQVSAMCSWRGGQ